MNDTTSSMLHCAGQQPYSASIGRCLATTRTLVRACSSNTAGHEGGTDRKL